MDLHCDEEFPVKPHGRSRLCVDDDEENKDVLAKMVAHTILTDSRVAASTSATGLVHEVDCDCRGINGDCFANLLKRSPIPPFVREHFLAPGSFGWAVVLAKFSGSQLVTVVMNIQDSLLESGASRTVVPAHVLQAILVESRQSDAEMNRIAQILARAWGVEEFVRGAIDGGLILPAQLAFMRNPLCSEAHLNASAADLLVMSFDGSLPDVLRFVASASNCAEIVNADGVCPSLAAHAREWAHDILTLKTFLEEPMVPVLCAVTSRNPDAARGILLPCLMKVAVTTDADGAIRDRCKRLRNLAEAHRELGALIKMPAKRKVDVTTQSANDAAMSFLFFMTGADAMTGPRSIKRVSVIRECGAEDETSSGLSSSDSDFLV